MEFTYDAYSNMIIKLKDKGYSFSGYEESYKFSKCVILRHDIDYSIDKAVELANLEYKLGIKSTYFVLLSSPFYNIISNPIAERLRKISALGHDIGLHFDEMNYDKDYYAKNGGVKNVVLNEIRLMEQILKMEIKSVSMHRPSKETLEANYSFGKIVNSYGHEFFKSYKYISDSRKRWRENIDEIIELNKFDKLHILTHAFWYNYVNETIEETISKFIADAIEDRYNMLNDNISDLEEIVKK